MQHYVHFLIIGYRALIWTCLHHAFQTKQATSLLCRQSLGSSRNLSPPRTSVADKGRFVPLCSSSFRLRLRTWGPEKFARDFNGYQRDWTLNPVIYIPYRQEAGKYLVGEGKDGHVRTRTRTFISMAASYLILTQTLGACGTSTWNDCQAQNTSVPFHRVCETIICLNTLWETVVYFAVKKMKRS